MNEYIVTVTERVTNETCIRILAENKFNAMRYAGELYRNQDLAGHLECLTTPDVSIDVKEPDGESGTLLTYYTNDKSKWDRY